MYPEGFCHWSTGMGSQILISNSYPGNNFE